MTNEDNDWFKMFFQDEEAQLLRARAERIEEDMNTVYELSFMVPREQAIETCNHYYKLNDGNFDIDSLMYMASMINSIIVVMEAALAVDGINPMDEDD